MPDNATDKKKDVPIFQLLPNLLTIMAICAGLTAIRFGYEGNYEMAVRLIVAACVLDGLDGGLARMMKAESPIGAELDSLADFLNFGVAPVLILHSWTLQDFRGAGWLAVLTYSICCVLRLARFNVSSRLETGAPPSDFFVGVPAPAGALLVLLPMVLSFAVSDLALAPPTIIAAYVCVVGLLMISRIPTYSFKNAVVDRRNTKFVLLGTVLLTAALLTYLWATLTLLTFAYIGCIIWGLTSVRRSRKAQR
ncbi:CDP-diacylglycerol--serine O-phosphatidyltransferase [Tropicimonas sp. TH_r6]|uniref:CDP-diacylglycerol--serine O-phosphatidyltransferase n=1 Tax=Tropicimonas sp. TH_r6 TaxID=3082085 RepID=UPI00295467E8|nr:CDP-diacylglycerol--serine O-phosphatidyltransferase [Tropicimonas sp. TH_r6]MDV7143445.1 CDP-diacylglycerol--serine O-phosphatidyltransferase [Tropicimonas sp. TH_r6]